MAYPPPAGYGYPPPPHEGYGHPGYGAGPPPSHHYDAYSHHPPPHGQPPASGYGAPPSAHDHFRHPGGGYELGYPPPGGSYPPPGGYPPPAAGGYPPPGAEYGFAPPGGPPPSYPPPGYPPPGPGFAPPPGYGYGPPPPGYGPPPPGYPPHPGAPGGRPPSPGRRGRSRSPRRGGRQDNRRGGQPVRGSDNRQGRPKEVDTRGPPKGNPNDPRSKVQHWLVNRPEWSAMWFEGIDPPRRSATTPNVTLLVLDHHKLETQDNSQDFGFVLAHSRVAAKKKDRERDCAKDLVAQVDAFPMNDPKAWCQIPASSAKKEVKPEDLEKVKELVNVKCPKTTVELPEPMVCVLTGICGYQQADRPNAPDPDFGMLNRFDPGFSELFLEARRVSGLVRKQWFLASVNVRKEGQSQQFALGVGLATDRETARVRAVHSASLRAHVLTEEILSKALGESEDKAVEKEIPAPVVLSV